MQARRRPRGEWHTRWKLVTAAGNVKKQRLHFYVCEKREVRSFLFCEKVWSVGGRISVFPRRDVNDRPSSVLILSGVFGNGSRKDWNRECVKEWGCGGGVAASIIMLSTCIKFRYHFCRQNNWTLKGHNLKFKVYIFFLPEYPITKACRINVSTFFASSREVFETKMSRKLWRYFE